MDLLAIDYVLRAVLASGIKVAKRFRGRIKAYDETETISVKLPGTRMARLLSQFSRSMTDALGHLAPETIGLAVSGGVDSIALTSLTSAWSKNRAAKLKAFVVDHNLRENSQEEAQAVSKYLTERFDLETKILSLKRVEDHGSSGSNVEEWARIARRSSLFQACQAEGVFHLLMGHHMNDQIELFIQRFISGSTWLGLAGMRRSAPMSISFREAKDSKSVRIIRPLLDASKRDLIEWCQERDIEWWEDPSNTDIDLTKRNLIRRMYQLGAEPASFTQERVKGLMDFLNKQRELAASTSDYVTRQLSLRGDLKRMPALGTSSLIVSNELISLPKVVLSEILFRIIAPISPLDDNKLGMRRRKLDSIADRIQQKNGDISDQGFCILGVQISQDRPNSPISFTRERPRHNSVVGVTEFRATHEWSDWELVDHRWFLRWKLPSLESTGDVESMRTRYFTAKLGVNPSDLLELLSPTLSEGARKRLKEHIETHPLLIWCDNHSSDELSRENIIGFPTLESTTSLQVEVIPKTCDF